MKPTYVKSMKRSVPPQLYPDWLICFGGETSIIKAHGPLFIFRGFLLEQLRMQKGEKYTVRMGLLHTGGQDVGLIQPISCMALQILCEYPEGTAYVFLALQFQCLAQDRQ